MIALPTAAALVSLSLLFLVRYAMHALRSFSRRDLSDRCDAAGKTDRFGAILLCRDRAIEDLAAASLLAATAYGGAIFAAAGEFAGGWAAAGYLVGASAAMLLAGGLLPWAAARVSAEGFLVGCWPAVAAFLKVSGPGRSFADRIDRAAHRLVGRPDPDEHATTDVVEGEILAVVEQGQDDGVIKPGVRRRIDRVVSLGEADAARVMTPRTKMNVLRATATVEQARAEFLEAGHSRMPVIGESTDDVVGLLYAKDLLPSLDGRGSFEDPTAAITPLLREPVFVPETLGIDALLDQMKRQQRHLVTKHVLIERSVCCSGLAPASRLQHD
ncbi:MAG: CBS domain-containing protein, partial [Planctomycetota bacterium]